MARVFAFCFLPGHKKTESTSEYLDPNHDSDNLGPNPGPNPEPRFLPLEAGAGENTLGTRALNHPTPEKLRHLLYGSWAAIDRTIKILHAYGYADPNDWSAPIPTEHPGQWMVIMIKTLLIESRLARAPCP